MGPLEPLPAIATSRQGTAAGEATEPKRLFSPDETPADCLKRTLPRSSKPALSSGVHAGTRSQHVLAETAEDGAVRLRHLEMVASYF